MSKQGKDFLAKELRRAFCCVFCKRKKRPKVLVQIRIAVGKFSIKFTGDFQMESPDTEGKIVDFNVKFTDAAGNPAPVQGVPTITSDRPDIVAIQNVSADGLSAQGVFQGPLGAANITIEGDADLGDGVVSVVIAGVMVRTGTQATGGSIEFGTPHD